MSWDAWHERREQEWEDYCAGGPAPDWVRREEELEAADRELRHYDFVLARLWA